MKFSKAVFILSGTIFLGLAVSAQSTNPGPAGSTDTTRRIGMRHNFRPRNGGDSLHRHEGWGQGGRETGRFGGGEDGRGWREGRPGERGQEGRHRLHYSPEQRQQMMAINVDYRKKSEDLFKKDNSTLGEYKAGLIALRKEKKSKLEALITPAQKDEITKWKAGRSENRQVMAAARMERLKLRLNLSDDQVARLKSGQAGLRAQMQSIHENDNLLPQQKREQLKGLRARREDALKSVLTPDQLAKFQEMQKSRTHQAGNHGFHSMEDEGR